MKNHTHIAPRPCDKCGDKAFTLLEMSIVLLIIGVIMGGGAVIFAASLQKKQTDETKGKLAVIQQRLLEYRRSYNRLPCPADVTTALQDTSGNFGVEATYPGACLGGTPAANSYKTKKTYTGKMTAGSATLTGMNSTTGITTAYAFGVSDGTGGYITGGSFNANSPYVDGGGGVVLAAGGGTVTIDTPATTTSAAGTALTFVDHVEGMVPVKTLKLSDDYAFDGWGHRIMYAVDAAFTSANAFISIPINDPDTSARITVTNSGAGVTKTTMAVYVLLSYGADGFCAYPRGTGATSPIAQINTAAATTNPDEKTNCAGISTTSSSTFVQNLPTQTYNNVNNAFDDIVVYATRKDLRGANE